MSLESNMEDKIATAYIEDTVNSVSSCFYFYFLFLHFVGNNNIFIIIKSLSQNNANGNERTVV